jgi:tRNA-2-methylthio-N6-dimethylallyladenosine synthase
MTSGKQVKIFTYGCQMNVYDSEHLLQNLAQLGYRSTEVTEEADLVILNTCSVREKAAQKVYSTLGRLKAFKRRNPELLLVVAGCVAQQEQEALARRVPYLDIVMGPDHISRVNDLVEEARRTRRQVVATRFLDDPETIFSPGAALTGEVPIAAFVTVMKGCDQYCSYCIVPYTRGRETSKSPEAVIEEVKALLAAGVREVCLLGQNVNRYGMDREGYPRFHELLRRVHDLPGLRRLRFVTSHPADCTDELIDCFTALPRLTPFCHLPMQSGSDAVLQRMNRRYDRARYNDRVARLRDAVPGIHLSTDLIVGFPGETDAEFEETMEVARAVRWGSAFSFKYSPRPGTRAAQMADDVPAAVKQARLEKLQQLLYDTMHEAMARHVGETVEVLVEGASCRPFPASGGSQHTGRTGTNYIVNFDVAEGTVVEKGDLVRVGIEKTFAHSLYGKLVV